MDRTPFDESVKVAFPIVAFALAVGVTAMTLPRGAWAIVTCPSGGDAMLPQGGDGQDLEVTRRTSARRSP